MRAISLACYHTLMLTCELWTYLADLDEQAWELVQKMNSIRNRAEELVS